MRTSTGNAVMLIAAPMNSGEWQRPTSEGAYGYQATAGDGASERERHDDADQADDERQPAYRAQVANVEAPADQEHEEHEADLTDHAERRQR